MRDCSTTQFRGYFDRAGDRASLTFHDLKRDDAPASPLLPSFPHPFPRKEDARCSAGGWLVLVIYLQTVRVREERERLTITTSATRYSFYVLRLNQPGYMYANVMPGPEGQVKKMARHRGRNHVETHYGLGVGAWPTPRSATRIHQALGPHFLSPPPPPAHQNQS